MAMKATSAKKIAFRWLPIQALTMVLGSTVISMCSSSRPAHAQPQPTVRVTVSPGSEVTPADLQTFNDAWMTRPTREATISWATHTFTNPFEPGAWTTADHMEAMVGCTT